MTLTLEILAYDDVVPSLKIFSKATKLLAIIFNVLFEVFKSTLGSYFCVNLIVVGFPND